MLTTSFSVLGGLCEFLFAGPNLGHGNEMHRIGPIIRKLGKILGCRLARFPAWPKTPPKSTFGTRVVLAYFRPFKTMAKNYGFWPRSEVPDLSGMTNSILPQPASAFHSDASYGVADCALMTRPPYALPDRQLGAEMAKVAGVVKVILQLRTSFLPPSVWSGRSEQRFDVQLPRQTTT